MILSLAFSWPFVLIARFIDRFEKGTRTLARDALIAESSENSVRGRAFGFHRALDTLGGSSCRANDCSFGDSFFG